MSRALPLRHVKPGPKADFMVDIERDSKFVGRKEILEKIKNRFKTERRIALCGIGGIG